MKKISVIIMAFLLSAIFNCCKKSDYPPFHQKSCWVTSATVSGLANYNTTYTYNATTGFVSNEITHIGGVTFEYKYFRKKNGEIDSVRKSYNSGQDTTLKFTYLSGRVIKAEEFVDNRPTGHVNHILYNSAGLISVITNEYTYNAGFSGKTFFDYNSFGQFTKITSTDLIGKIRKQEIYYNIGSSSVSSDVYLMDHGLPFQLLFSYAYRIGIPGIGTSIAIYSADPNGKMILQDTLSLNSKKLNMLGYTESFSFVDTKQNIAIGVLYTFNCNNIGYP